MSDIKILYVKDPADPRGPAAGPLAWLPGAECLETAAAEIPASGGFSLLLCDRGPGGKLAGGVLEKRDALAPGVPVIVLAAALSPAEEAALLERGADACLAGERLALLPAAAASLLLRARASLLRGRALELDTAGRVAGALVHDFNNILGAIEGYATLNMRHLSPEDPLLADLNEIRKAVAKASALSKQMLVFSRRQAVSRAPLACAQFLSAVRQKAELQSGGRARIESQLADPLPGISADQVQLERLLLALLANAAEVTPEGGVIRLAAAAAARPGGGGLLKISVSDEGPGLPAAASERLFEPFFTTKPKGKGAGFGLAAAYGIARQHGGWIEARSLPGRGAEFTVFLPAAVI